MNAGEGAAGKATAFEKIRSIIAESLGVVPTKISLSSKLVADFDADSLDLLELNMTIEREFGIEFNEGELEAFTSHGDVTVEDLVTLVLGATIEEPTMPRQETEEVFATTF